MKAKIITELEADFGVIRSTERKIYSALPKHTDEAAHGLFFTLHTHYQNPTFTCIKYDNGFLIPQPASALFELDNGKWNVLDNGIYTGRIDEMLEILIKAYGGERG